MDGPESKVSEESDSLSISQESEGISEIADQHEIEAKANGYLNDSWNPLK
jgi:hypothetical protein